MTILAPSDGAWWRFLWDNGEELWQPAVWQPSSVHGRPEWWHHEASWLFPSCIKSSCAASTTSPTWPPLLSLLGLPSAGLFLRQLSSLGDKLTSVITFHVLPTALHPDRFYNRESGAQACLLCCLLCVRLAAAAPNVSCGCAPVLVPTVGFSWLGG